MMPRDRKNRRIEEMAQTINPRLIVEATDAATDALEAVFAKYERFSPADVVCVCALLSNVLQSKANDTVQQARIASSFVQFIETLSGGKVSD